jgi:hypothetical protein
MGFAVTSPSVREEEALDAAIDQYERATDLREAGQDEQAIALVETALASIEEHFSKESAIARARFAITRADLASRVRSTEDAIVIATDAVERARRVRRDEPLVEASALYMLGKAERSSALRRHGAGSFERSHALFRRLVGDDNRYTADAAGALGTACFRLAEWQRAANALDLVIAHDPDGPALIHVLHRAIACERLGEHEKAKADLVRWRAEAKARSVDEQVEGHLCAARIASALGDAAASAAELAHAQKLSRALPSAPALQASLLEGSAWGFATAATPPWMLVSEVLIRRAAALAWSPSIADTATRIAMLWRYGVEEVFVQPTFAVLEIEACLQVWDSSSATYAPRPGHQKIELAVAGSPTTLERLADERWRDLAAQRVFSAFHAEQFKANEPNFVAPVRSQVHRLQPEHMLALLPQLRIPKWATTNTVALSSLGEVEIVSAEDFTMLAMDPASATLAPSSSIPLLPGS